jgi:DNA-binding phage protein
MEVQRKRLIQIKIVERERRNKIMTLTRDFKEIVNARIQSDPTFAAALLDEAISLFLNGEPKTARLILRDLINSTVGFEELAIETSKPSKSLHRMLSAKGNPTMDNLTIILNVLRKKLDVDIKVQTVPCLQN